MRFIGPWMPLTLAGVLTAVWASLHLMGWRASTLALSGTIDPANPYTGPMMGLAYAAAWFAFVVFAPILAGGGVLWWASAPRRRAPAET